MKLLLAEDDAMLGDSMEKGLNLAGFTLDRVRDGQHVLNALESHTYDVILLDIGLPKIDGLELLRRMRQQGVGTPVMFVTARDAVHDRVAGLNLGADDYLSKPFDLDELTARIHALARRQAGQSQPQLQLGRLQLNPIERLARLGETALALSPREFDLLEILMRQPGAVLSLDLRRAGLLAELESAEPERQADQHTGWPQRLPATAKAAALKSKAAVLTSKVIAVGAADIAAENNASLSRHPDVAATPAWQSAPGRGAGHRTAARTRSSVTSRVRRGGR